MGDSDLQSEGGAILASLRMQAAEGAIRLILHAQQELVDDCFALDYIVQALSDAVLLEHYAEHRRGPCCLVFGSARDGRPMHVVCTTAREVAIIITVYEPKPPKWKSPLTRGTVS